MLSFYEACIRQSKSAPLKVTIDLEGFSDWNDQHFLRTNSTRLLTLFVEQTREHATRWKEFVWNHDRSLITAQYFLEYLPQELPSLQRLTINLHWDKLIERNQRQFPICPNLQTLSLIDIWDDNDEMEAALFQKSEFLSVKSLLIGNGMAWMDIDFRYMANFQNIHTLTLASLSGDVICECDATSPVNVPHLRLLRLRGRVPHKVLSLIIPPDNLTVVVEDSDEPQSIDTLYGTGIAKEMTTLHVDWSESISLSSAFELLKDASRLEAVYLSRQVEETLLGHKFEQFRADHGYSFSIYTGVVRVS